MGVFVLQGFLELRQVLALFFLDVVAEVDPQGVESWDEILVAYV